MQNRQRSSSSESIIREAVARTRYRAGLMPFSTTCRAGKSSGSHVSELLAHRALWIRRLRRRSRRRERFRSLRLHCSFRSLRLALTSRCLPHSLADEKRVCSLPRPGQRRASLAQHGGRAISDARSFGEKSMIRYSVAGVSRVARQVSWASGRRTDNTCTLTSRC
jgi:hypothetical protein